MSDARLLAFVGGIGSGKTQGGVIRAIRAAYGDVGTHKIETPNVGVITAPTYQMLRDATLRTFMDVGRGLVESYNSSNGLMVLKNGSEIMWRSAEVPDRLRGPNIAWWFGDEAAMYRDTVYNIMIGRLRQFAKLGHAWLGTTPKGRNWLWRKFVQRPSLRHAIIQATSQDNIFLDSEIYELWEQEYSGAFAEQELGGKFVAFEGLVYVEYDSAIHNMPLWDHHHVKDVTAGVDWGFANPGCILVANHDGDKNIQIVAEEYRRQTRIEEWVAIALQLRDTWGIQRFYCDPSEPDNIAKFRAAGLKAERATNDVLPGIQDVKAALVVSPVTGKPRLTLTAPCVNTETEMEQYSWMENRYGLQDAPVKANDHAMDTLRYVIMGLRKGKKKLPIGRTHRTI